MIRSNSLNNMPTRKVGIGLTQIASRPINWLSLALLIAFVMLCSHDGAILHNKIISSIVHSGESNGVYHSETNLMTPKRISRSTDDPTNKLVSRPTITITTTATNQSVTLNTSKNSSVRSVHNNLSHPTPAKAQRNPISHVEDAATLALLQLIKSNRSGFEFRSRNHVTELATGRQWERLGHQWVMIDPEDLARVEEVESEKEAALQKFRSFRHWVATEEEEHRQQKLKDKEEFLAKQREEIIQARILANRGHNLQNSEALLSKSENRSPALNRLEESKTKVTSSSVVLTSSPPSTRKSNNLFPISASLSSTRHSHRGLDHEASAKLESEFFSKNAVEENKETLKFKSSASLHSKGETINHKLNQIGHFRGRYGSKLRG